MVLSLIEPLQFCLVHPLNVCAVVKPSAWDSFLNLYFWTFTLLHFVCQFKPEARSLTSCGWVVLAWMSAGELLFYFAESPLTFISLHLLFDGDSKRQGPLSLPLSLSICPFSLSSPLFPSLVLSSSNTAPSPSQLFPLSLLSPTVA